jgi:hypothetical protein
LIFFVAQDFVKIESLEQVFNVHAHRVGITDLTVGHIGDVERQQVAILL